MIEGDWAPRTVVVVEFPSADRARPWYASDDYAPAPAENPDAMTRNMIIDEGRTGRD